MRVAAGTPHKGSEMQAGIAERQEPRWKRESGVGLACSLLLHGAALLLILLGLPSLLRPPAEQPQVVPVDLVRLGDATTSPQAEQKAEVPQEQVA